MNTKTDKYYCDDIMKKHLQIFVSDCNGNGIKLDVTNGMNINDIKKLIKSRINLNTNKQILSFEGKILNNNKFVYQYNIYNESVLYLNGKINGGCDTEHCCYPDACCLFPEGPCLCFPCKIIACAYNSVFGFICHCTCDKVGCECCCG
mmetsp:Transcript_52846/g.64759  ORF Transcript_52846/g.64759 Transcript_52846/m.64759 type:complete len:148 (-) Transcript_52846:98-541(-)